MSYNPQDRMRAIIAKYSYDFVPHRPGQKELQGHVIALTGATGNIGSLMLDMLLKNETVKKIYILHRDETGTPKGRIANELRQKGVDPTVLDTARIPLVYLKVDLSQWDLGLDAAVYMDLRDNVTHVIHSAWLLNFKIGLDPYIKTHIAGVRNIIDLVLSSPQKRSPRLIFLSSIAAAAEYKGPSKAPYIGESHKYIVPEGPVDDPSMALRIMGYGQSKYISERIIVNAIEHGLRATISRVGNLGGITTTGYWAGQEHGNMLMKAALSVGIFPTDFPSLRWLPVDIAASALIKQSFVDGASLQYFSIENPFPMHSDDLCKAFQDMSPNKLTFLPLVDIFNFVEKAQFNPSSMPVVSLLEFYRYMLLGGMDKFAVLGWDNSVTVAPELATFKAKMITDTLKKYIAHSLQSTDRSEDDQVISKL